jgi:hypothetical protein
MFRRTFIALAVALGLMGKDNQAYDSSIIGPGDQRTVKGDFNIAFDQETVTANTTGDTIVSHDNNSSETQFVIASSCAVVGTQTDDFVWIAFVEDQSGTNSWQLRGNKYQPVIDPVQLIPIAPNDSFVVNVDNFSGSDITVEAEVVWAE